jgi:signal transduction histidine kinase
MQDETQDRWLNIERYAPWLVLFLSLTFTYLLWQSAHRASAQEQKIEFDSRVRDINDRITRRITYYEQVLYGVRAFYLHQHEIEPQEFSGYLTSLEIEKNFPGVQGVSYAPLIPEAKIPAHLKAMRLSGLPFYRIVPEGRRALYAPVTLIFPPSSRNRRVLGFDNLSNPKRKATIERARDENRALISEKLVLMQEDESAPQAGFLMFLPLFHKEMPHDSPQARQKNIVGWFAASFRMDDLMSGVLGERANGIRIGIFDGDEIGKPSRMFGSLLEDNAQHPPLFASVSQLEVAGRKWTTQFSTLPEFEAGRDDSRARDVAVAGVLLSVLLTLTAWLVVRGRQRAIQMNLAIGRELEMRKEAELKTRDLNLFNEAILDKSPSGIAVFETGGACVMANHAFVKTLGGTRGQVLQQDFRHDAAWQRNGMLHFADLALDSGLTLRRDIEGKTSFDQKMSVECIFAPIQISERPHLLLIMNDISGRIADRRALTESMQKLEEKELAKTRFLAAAGHDLRQPMAAANLFIDALKLSGPTPRQSEIIGRLDVSMSTFNGLLDALLDVSKLDAGMIKPEYTAINVAELLNGLEQNFAPIATEKQLAFRLYFPMKKMLVVRSDIGLIKSVLMNLVSNALKFTSKGGILVSARAHKDRVLFQVWDSGMGIPREHIERIFDEFYQVDNPQRDRSSGLGLGLSIVKRALTLVGAKISCRSQAGRGSVFEFSLPLHHAAPATPAPARDEETRSESAAEPLLGKRFVVVEDDALVAQAMILWLEGMGGEVKCFHSAEEALRHTNIEYADFFIADYMLGGKLSGIQFLQKLREKTGTPVKAVLVTGDTSPGFVRQTEKCDWPILHKPINTSKLLAHLRG